MDGRNETAAQPATATALCAVLQAIGGGLGWSVVPPLLPQIAREVGISHTMGGVVWGAAPLGIALSAPIGGAAVDRFGARRVASAAMLFGALACAARVFAHGAWSFAIAMFAFGLHIGFVAPSIPKILAAHVPLARVGRANGIAVTSYTLGTAIVALLARTVIAPALGGWRPTMLVAALAMALAGVAFFALVRDRGAVVPHASVFDSLELVRNGQLVRVASMQFLLFGGYLALLGTLPRLLSDRGLSPQRVGVAVATWLAVAALGNYVGPSLSDALGRRRVVIAVGAVLASAGLFAMAVLPARLSTGCLVLSAIGGGAFAPLLLSLPLEIEGIGPQRAGAALGVLMLVGQVGGFLLPIATGTAAHLGGLSGALVLLGIAHLAILVPAMGLRERAPSRAAAAAPAVAG
jgi:CP family cyanate transporter-like MFS transporter